MRDKFRYNGGSDGMIGAAFAVIVFIGTVLALGSCHAH